MINETLLNTEELLSVVTDPNDSRPLYLRIADHLEEQILRGQIPSNSRLSNTADLSETFQVSLPTMQQALARLSKRGLLRRIPRRGTFVKTPTSTTVVGLISGGDPFRLETAFYRLLFDALQENATRLNLELDLQYSVEGPHFIRTIRRLESEIRANRYQCLLIICSSVELTAWLKTEDLIPAFAPTSNNLGEAAHDAVAYLLGRGFRRMAIVSQLAEPAGSPEHTQERQGVEAAFKEVGMEINHATIQYWGKQMADGYHGVKRLFAGPKSTWPEALFINHDVVTKGALTALTQLGLSVPRDVALLTHANKGDDFLYPLPLTRLEYDPFVVADSMLRYVNTHWKRTRPGMAYTPLNFPYRLIIGKSCGE